MLQMDGSIKNLYKSDSIRKWLYLEFSRPGESQPFLAIGPANIKRESMKLTESISSGGDLMFGSCEASQISLTLIDVEEDVKGAEMLVYQYLDGKTGQPVSFGKYQVRSAKRQANRRYRDIIALDAMVRLDINVAGWYNALKFPLTLKKFRAALLAHVGITEDPDVGYLLNDGIIVGKNADISEISGRDLLEMAEEINGVFGHIDRNGVFKHVYLSPQTGMLPAGHLYPKTDTFPSGKEPVSADLTGVLKSEYSSAAWEDYTVKEIDRVVIIDEEGNEVASYGTGENVYTVENNILLYDRTYADLMSIAYNLYGMVAGRPYTPLKRFLGKGKPWVEVGDSLEIATDAGIVRTYVLGRTLSGIQALKDEYEASGYEERSYDSSISRTMNIFINKAKATFKVLDGEIDLRVTYKDVVSAINLSPEEATIKAPKISLEGIVTANERFRILTDGSMEAVNGKFSGDIVATNITGSQVSGGTITGTELIGTTIEGGDDIPFVARQGSVSIGDFLVNDEYGRHVFQSEDECTGMSTGDIGRGEWFLWAGYGYGSGSERTVFLVNDGQARVEGELILNGRNIMDIIKDYNGSGCTDSGGGCGCDGNSSGCRGDGGCDDIPLIDDIGGCGYCGSDDSCSDSCTSNCPDTPVTCGGDTCTSHSEGPGC